MGRFDGAYESRDMSLDTMTEGISKAGMENLLEMMQVKLLSGVRDELSKTEGIVSALKAGWQGKSRDVFLEKLDKSVSGIATDLANEYYDLMKRMRELAENYYKQDQRMMDMLN